MIQKIRMDMSIGSNIQKNATNVNSNRIRSLQK